ncbi:S-layer protein [Planktothrix sp. FACHB-1365]|uniref:S-layer protein n=1 Tax=Planktothrix sp. FACHB-1365 TaxID=2692855 RepID=UPI001683ED2E|nr:S-layer protein [Planktothrix sp. FACHB-1365]MBD2481761.1 S-layer protein [Planktothrix sp. FACHB-1365]
MKPYYLPLISITLLTIIGLFTPLKAEEKPLNISQDFEQISAPTREEIINACIQNQADRLPNPYIDVEPTHWAYKAVLSLYYCGAFRQATPELLLRREIGNQDTNLTPNSLPTSR